VLALALAFLGGALIIWVTSGRLGVVAEAYGGMLDGAFFKTRGLSETFVAMIPYLFLGLALALGFAGGLFNIGVEGQYIVGALCAAWAGSAFTKLPALVHLPLALGAGAAGGALWAMLPGYLKVRTGAHEVITLIMMNFIAFRLTELFVSGPLRDTRASAVQTPRVSASAELWSLHQVPERLGDPLNALAVALLCAIIAAAIASRTARRRGAAAGGSPSPPRRLLVSGVGATAGLAVFLALPPLARAWWPFDDRYDRLHVGIVLALVAAAVVRWLLWRTTLGFEIRTIGANPAAARYAGMDVKRGILLTMALSGALAGVAGTIEVLSVAIALLAGGNAFGIVLGSFVFGAMRNGADVMELRSGVSKDVISLIQGLVLLFAAAPALVRVMVRQKPLADEARSDRGGDGA
jgi:simple sugar transport system permease protein